MSGAELLNKLKTEEALYDYLTMDHRVNANLALDTYHFTIVDKNGIIIRILKYPIKDDENGLIELLDGILSLEYLEAPPSGKGMRFAKDLRKKELLWVDFGYGILSGAIKTEILNLSPHSEKNRNFNIIAYQHTNNAIEIETSLRVDNIPLGNIIDKLISFLDK